MRWEWRDDDFSFKPFKERQNAALEKAWSMGSKTLEFAVGPLKYAVDFENMTQMNIKSKKERLLRRVGPSGEVVARGPVWEWESAPGVFVAYDVNNSTEIEKAFMQDSLTTKIKVSKGPHDIEEMTIHFGHMQQINPSKEGARKIRRVVRLFESPVASAHPPAAPVASEDAARQLILKKKLEEAGSGASATPMPSEDAPPAKARRTEACSVAASAPKKDVKFPSLFAGPLIPSTEGSQMSDWRLEGTALILNCIPSTLPRPVRVAAFDLDDTLVMPASGAVFPKSRSDWTWLTPAVPAKLQELHRAGYAVVIISNQGGIANKGWNASKAAEIQGKVLDLIKASSVPLSALLATKEDEIRKPSTAMWELLTERMIGPSIEIDLKSSVYVGDAAGRHIITLANRTKDFSCSDRKFALNVGVPFQTPEEYFAGKAPAKFEWDGFGPEDIARIPHTYPAATYHQSGQEMVVLMGFPGCGKSTFFRRFFQPHGYVHVNRDTMKTPEKCMAAADAALRSGKSVVVDNTNPSKEERARYTGIARSCGVPCRCIVLTADAKLANHMNIMRARLQITPRVSSIAYNMYKSKYEACSTAEGFTEVITVPPVACFDGLPPQAEAYFNQGFVIVASDAGHWLAIWSRWWAYVCPVIA